MDAARVVVAIAALSFVLAPARAATPAGERLALRIDRSSLDPVGPMAQEDPERALAHASLASDPRVAPAAYDMPTIEPAGSLYAAKPVGPSAYRHTALQPVAGAQNGSQYGYAQQMSDGLNGLEQGFQQAAQSTQQAAGGLQQTAQGVQQLTTQAQQAMSQAQQAVGAGTTQDAWLAQNPNQPRRTIGTELQRGVEGVGNVFRGTVEAVQGTAANASDGIRSVLGATPQGPPPAKYGSGQYVPGSYNYTQQQPPSATTPGFSTQWPGTAPASTGQTNQTDTRYSGTLPAGTAPANPWPNTTAAQQQQGYSAQQPTYPQQQGTQQTSPQSASARQGGQQQGGGIVGYDTRDSTNAQPRSTNWEWPSNSSQSPTNPPRLGSFAGGAGSSTGSTTTRADLDPVEPFRDPNTSSYAGGPSGQLQGPAFPSGDLYTTRQGSSAPSGWPPADSGFAQTNTSGFPPSPAADSRFPTNTTTNPTVDPWGTNATTQQPLGPQQGTANPMLTAQADQGAGSWADGMRTQMAGFGQSGAAVGEKPWELLVVSTLGCLGSLAANLYLGMNYIDLRHKFRAALRRGGRGYDSLAA